MTKDKPELTAERLCELLSFEDGVWRWRASRGAVIKAGDVAGDKQGRIGIDGRNYSAKRLAVLFTTGEWPRDYSKIPLTQNRLKSLLDYSHETGIFTWRVNRSGGIKAGDEAGYVGTDGYVYISVDYCLYRAHRLARFWLRGEWTPRHLNTVV